MQNSYFCKNSYLNVYELASKKSNISTQLIYGEKFRIIGKKKDFFKIRTDFDNYLGFIKIKKFPINIEIIADGKKILNTGGGILNMINNSSENDFLVFNPDTLWSDNYIKEIKDMCNLYSSNKFDLFFFYQQFLHLILLQLF